MNYSKDLDFALAMDREDPLASYRSRFYIPHHGGSESIYLCGNSLGCLPKTARHFVEVEFEDWQNLAVEGHFKGKNPWMLYHHFLAKSVAKLVGAKEKEVVVMNNLTVNLHLMMVSFYQPTSKRYKIIAEAGAFPSDEYALETQVKFHGLKPDESIIELKPRAGEDHLRTEDILSEIDKTGDELALVMMGGVNYYTGQFFELDKITKAGHEVGAKVGFDLAHAAGNLPLELHNWGPDFAVWCSYKYLNSGPGGTSGVFVHERHAKSPNLNRFAGWWGHDEEQRFLMNKGFIPMEGAQGWQLSNAQIFPMAIHRSSLEIFDEVGMDTLREKSLKLTGYCEFLLNQILRDLPECGLKIITPKDPNQRGCQLSILAHKNGKQVFDALTNAGVISDWREPNVIRIAPVPLYNTFHDVWRFSEIVRTELAKT